MHVEVKIMPVAVIEGPGTPEITTNAIQCIYPFNPLVKFMRVATVTAPLLIATTERYALSWR